MRHALSHMRCGKLKCILCGERFKELPFAKKHVLDHIDEMGKQKPPDEESGSVDMQDANGKEDNGENASRLQEENQTSISSEKTNQKPRRKRKAPNLKRENRIIRNFRTLVKKTSVFHANMCKEADFKDEQVVIQDGLVTVRDSSVVENKEHGEGGETPAAENGHRVDITCHLCPSESCDRVFLKISSTLKHAIKCHVKEEKVLEKTFALAKCKCTLCGR